MSISLPFDTYHDAYYFQYGFAPKGSSLVLYSDPLYRHHQYYASHSWPGGLYGSPSMSGSRSGGNHCWSLHLHILGRGNHKFFLPILILQIIFQLLWLRVGQLLCILAVMVMRKL